MIYEHQASGIDTCHGGDHGHVRFDTDELHLQQQRMWSGAMDDVHALPDRLGVGLLEVVRDHRAVGAGRIPLVGVRTVIDRDRCDHDAGVLVEVGIRPDPGDAAPDGLTRCHR